MRTAARAARPFIGRGRGRAAPRLAGVVVGGAGGGGGGGGGGAVHRAGSGGGGSATGGDAVRRSGRERWARVSGSAGLPWVGRQPSRSCGAQRERVEVVGEDRPGGPGARAGVALEPGSVEAVASLEVADAAFGADAELGQPAVRLAAVRGVVATDEQPRGLGEVLADGAGLEAAVERDLSWPQLKVAEAVAGGGQQVGLVERPDAGARWEDQAPSAAARVLTQFGELHDVPELGRRAQLALADRPGVRIADRHQPVGDRLAREPQLDLRAHLLSQLTELLEPISGRLLGTGAATSRTLPQPGGKSPRFPNGLVEQLAGLPGQPQRELLALAGARGDRAVDPAQPARDRARTVRHARRPSAGQPARPVGFARERPRRVLGQPEVSRIADV